MNTGIMMLVIAGTRQGKTTKVKKIIGSNAPALIYDVNGEYGDIIPSTDTTEKRSRFFSKDVNDFLQIVGTKHNGTICVFEEATGFFKGATNKKTSQIIVGKRHPVEHGGRSLIFVFHTVNSVPPELLSNADYISLGRTGDEGQVIKRKSMKCYRAWQQLQGKPMYHFETFKNI